MSELLGLLQRIENYNDDAAYEELRDRLLPICRKYAYGQYAPSGGRYQGQEAEGEPEGLAVFQELLIKELLPRLRAGELPELNKDFCGRLIRELVASRRRNLKDSARKRLESVCREIADSVPHQPGAPIINVALNETAHHHRCDYSLKDADSIRDFLKRTLTDTAGGRQISVELGFDQSSATEIRYREIPYIVVIWLDGGREWRLAFQDNPVGRKKAGNRDEFNDIYDDRFGVTSDEIVEGIAEEGIQATQPDGEIVDLFTRFIKELESSPHHSGALQGIRYVINLTWVWLELGGRILASNDEAPNVSRELEGDAEELNENTEKYRLSDEFEFTRLPVEPSWLVEVDAERLSGIPRNVPPPPDLDEVTEHDDGGPPTLEQALIHIFKLSPRLAAGQPYEFRGRLREAEELSLDVYLSESGATAFGGEWRISIGLTQRVVTAVAWILTLKSTPQYKPKSAAAIKRSLYEWFVDDATAADSEFRRKRSDKIWAASKRWNERKPLAKHQGEET